LQDQSRKPQSARSQPRRQASLSRQQRQAADRDTFGRAWHDTGLVFTTRSGRPIEPRHLDRSFRRICDHGKIRVIAVHRPRHTTASLLKKLDMPPSGAQMILGHSRPQLFARKRPHNVFCSADVPIPVDPGRQVPHSKARCRRMAQGPVLS
jgi:hypothetical protein